ncbi:GDSL-type esterase/lipase family protein [Aeromicrobium sp. Sec7.5]|uniref:GDSL-type esterase/lipase family protein n=1 Tax=Aeromicrobium sp. Sec7.5 TaxID=3121276 RepID=UPI002FE4CE74
MVTRRHSAAMLIVALLSSLLVSVTLSAPPAAAVPAHRILITGDSITQGSSGDYTWRYRLWNKLAGTAPGNVEFVGTRTDLFDIVNNVHGSQHYAAPFSAKAHSARWGDSYTQELGQIGGQVTSTNANVLVVALGSNDLAYLTSPSETIANLTTYVNQARAAKPGIDIVVAEVVNRWNPWTQTHQITNETNQYAALLQTYAAQTNTAAERVVIASTRNGWDAQAHTWDGTHPNPTGEALIAQRISEGLAQLGIGTIGPNIATYQPWNVAAPTPTVTAGSEAATLGWSRVSTGSTGMFIQMRLVNSGQAFYELQAPASGNGWTVDILAAGGTYEFKIFPSKGFSRGTASPTVSRTVGGPQPATVPTLSAWHVGQTSVTLGWAASNNATGYMLSRRTMTAGGEAWVDLPYPVTATLWEIDLIYSGYYHQFRVLPNRAYLNGGWTYSPTTRTRGLPGNRVYTPLGDSYTAGTGTIPANTNPYCMIGTSPWPYDMQSSLQYLTSSKACGGAETDAIVDQMYEAMMSFNGSPSRPRLITMTIGGNDVGFASLIKQCVLLDCTNLEATAANRIDALLPTLTTLYSFMRQEQPYADIMVGGYPQVITVGGRGGLFDPLTCQEIKPAERAMADRLVIRLNNVITSAANAAGVWSVGQGVRSVFMGHGACSDNGYDDWIHDLDVNPIPNSFHPNASGQLGYAIAFGNALTARTQP